MIRTTAISALIALTLSSGPAFSQGNSNRDRDRDGRDDRRQNDNRGNNRGDRDNNRHDNRDFGRSHNEQRRHGRGVGPNHQYYRGDRLPSEYRHRNYVVNDWRGHHLSAPPRGQQWVQSGNDYILVAIATGVIMQMLMSN